MAENNNNQPETRAPENDALQSFLERETSDKTEKKQEAKKRKLSSNARWIIIGALAVAVIVLVVVLLLVNKSKVDTSEVDLGTDVTMTVDEKGVHQAALVLNEDGELDNNSYGKLLEYVPANIKEIEVSNQSGNYTIKAETPVSESTSESGQETGATVYTLVGYEDLNLKAGGADTIANDVASISFTSVADVTGENAADYGFNKPRAVIKTKYTDNTSSTITVGDDAPTGLGTYIMFGDSKTIYIVDPESADGFMFSVLDLIDLAVTETPTDTANTEVQSFTISGEGFKDEIEIRQNDDKAIDASYAMIKPKKLFVNEVEASNIIGTVRGLQADEAVCINPDSSQLSEYGLSKPYAKLVAVYPDATIELSASKPKDDSVYLMQKGNNIIYKVKASSVPFVSTSVSKLTPDIIIDPNYSSVSGITVIDNSGTYHFDVTTTTDTVTNESGEDEEVEVTTATYKGKELDSVNYDVFFQNIANMQNAGKATEDVSGSPELVITLSYSTGRADDTIAIYPTNSTKYTATLNGEVVGLVYKSYTEKFIDSVQDLIKGKTVQSF